MIKLAILFFLIILNFQTKAREMNLVWAEEFDGEALNENVWNYEEGFIRNMEDQYYTKRNINNVRVENGLLVIEAKALKVDNEKYVANSIDWRSNRRFAFITSGSINTKNKVNFGYGRIDIRAKLPEGMGVWPAAWLLGSNIDTVGYPKCGEVDIFEYYGKNPDLLTSNIHFVKDGKKKSNLIKLNTPNIKNGFHLYSFERDIDKLIFYYDGEKYSEILMSNVTGDFSPFDKDMFILINFAYGGDSGGEIDLSKLPQKMFVDFIRYYK